MSIYDINSHLWHNKTDKFFQNLIITPLQREPKECVATSLAVISNKKPEFYRNIINTQDPYTWSMALKSSGMKLAYCPTDIRRIEFYRDELLELDDLFLLSFYTSEGLELIKDPDNKGWLSSSHVAILHRDKVIDTKYCSVEKFNLSAINSFHTKRIFRVVSLDCERGM